MTLYSLLYNQSVLNLYQSVDTLLVGKDLICNSIIYIGSTFVALTPTSNVRRSFFNVLLVNNKDKVIGTNPIAFINHEHSFHSMTF